MRPHKHTQRRGSRLVPLGGWLGSVLVVGAHRRGAAARALREKLEAGLVVVALRPAARALPVAAAAAVVVAVGAAAVGAGVLAAAPAVGAAAAGSGVLAAVAAAAGVAAGVVAAAVGSVVVRL